MHRKLVGLFLFLALFLSPSLALADNTTVSELQAIFRQARNQTDAKLFIIIVDDPFITAQIAESANGKEAYLFVNLSKLWLINSADEWAFVIFHEVSHKVLADRKQKFPNPHDVEYACDLMSIELMHRYGYNKRAAINFFIKYNDSESSSHPSGRDRIKRIQQKIEELEAAPHENPQSIQLSP